MNEVEVTILCTTYNQELYIRQCLDSLLEQKTEFRYEILIHDDASTDSSLEIIREYEKRYPHIIRVMTEKKNQYTSGMRSIMVSLMLPLVRGNYIAICQGDDYWTDTRKLQKQYEIMIHNLGCSVCAHQTRIISEDGTLTSQMVQQRNISEGIIAGQDLLRWIGTEDTHLVHTSSLFVRYEAIHEIIGKIPEFMTVSCLDDRTLLMFLATKGDLYYIDEIMSNYRIMSQQSWSRTVTGDKYKYYLNDLDIIRVIDKYEEYSQGKYNVFFEEYRKRVEFRIKQYELSAKDLISERYRKYFSQLNARQKFYYYICAYIPAAGRIWRKMKRIMKKR